MNNSGIRVWSYPGIYPFPEGNDHATGIFIHKQNLALKALGSDVKVVRLTDGYPVWPFYYLFPDWRFNQKNTRPYRRMLDGIEIFHPKVHSPKPSRIFKKKYEDLCVDKLVSFLSKQGVKKGKDVLMAQWLIPDGRVAVRAAQRLNIPCAVEMQGDDIQVWPYNSEIHKQHAVWTLENADLVLGCSDFLCDEARKLYGKPLTTHTIYTGIDTEKFSPASSAEEKESLRRKFGLDKNDIAVLNVGSAIARKGWLELFEALGQLKSLGLSIKVLAAVGVFRELNLQEEARKHGIEKDLIDLGQINNNDLPDLYRACDIFCLASYWEGLANALCEAMASGCAVITSAVSGHPEVIQSGINGELVKAKDVEGLTNALKKLITDPVLREQYGRKARITAQEKIKSHEANAKKLLDLLNQI